MKIVFAQYLLLLIVIFPIVSIIKKYRRQKRLALLVFWLPFWLAIAGLIAFPQISQRAAEFLGIGRGVDLMIYLALLLVFLGIYDLLGRQQESEERLTKLARKIAIMEAKGNQNVEPVIKK